MGHLRALTHIDALKLQRHPSTYQIDGDGLILKDLKKDL